jgi:hypothetical protein
MPLPEVQPVKMNGLAGVRPPGRLRPRGWSARVCWRSVVAAVAEEPFAAPHAGPSTVQRRIGLAAAGMPH